LSNWASVIASDRLPRTGLIAPNLKKTEYPIWGPAALDSFRRSRLRGGRPPRRRSAWTQDHYWWTVQKTVGWAATRRDLSAVIAGLDPAIHEALPQ
jgi:hypothetical protein